MIEVEMSKDIQDFKPKIVGPFDGRQLICIGIMCAYGFPLLFLLPIASWSTRITIVVILCIPMILVGWVPIFDMPMEVFIKDCVIPFYYNRQKRIDNRPNNYSYLDPDPVVPALPEKQVKEKKKKAVLLAEEKERQAYGGLQVPSKK